MKNLFFSPFLFLSLFSVGQYPTDSIIKKHKIRKVVIALSTPYEKVIEEFIYDKGNRQLKYRKTEFDVDKKYLPQTYEWQSFYKDTFLLKQVLKVYTSKGKAVNDDEILYGYSKQPPFLKLWRSERHSSGEQKMEQYFYNIQNQLDSISFLSNDSSYSNGLRYPGNNLFYKVVKPFSTVKNVYNENGELLQRTECNNYSAPLNSPDSAGCRRIVYSKLIDILIQNITTWYRAGRKTVGQAKQIRKNDLVIY